MDQTVEHAEMPAPEAARFPKDPAADPPGLRGRLAEMLRVYRENATADPFGNPISRMALELTRLVDRGEISPSAIEQLIRHLTVRAFSARAKRLAAYAGEIDDAGNEARLEALLDRIVKPNPDGAPIVFPAFLELVDRWHYGIVFTAHPTFSMPLPLGRRLAALASGEETALAGVAEARHRPPRGLTLEDEFDWAMEPIAHADAAVERLRGIVLRVAARHYPDEWMQLRPRLVSVASWVGYDHDGRSDIGWTDALRMRLKVKQAQLVRLREAVQATWGDEATRPVLDELSEKLDAAIAEVARQVEVAGPGKPAPDRIRAIARRLVEGREQALTSTQPLLELLEKAIAGAGNADLAMRLSVLASGLAGGGLGMAHTHFRLNATQLHNAIRGDIGLEGNPGDPGHRRSYLNAVNTLLAEVQPVTVNLGSLSAERASARRMFILIATIAKHVDADTPIRFLIAETDTGFTLLAALYFARLFGVDHLVEISPLFETSEALDRGDRVIDEALRSEHFRAYVERQGRLAIQFGFSDSGRYIGQMGAAFWIERLRLRIAEVLGRHGLSGIEVVLFNTHGESIGRGGHPAGMEDRLRYVAPPASRITLAAAGVHVKEESSFQGGDGYLHFLSPGLAFANLARIVETLLEPDAEEVGDPIYREPDFSTEFFTLVRQEFARLVDDPDYAALLGMFGTNLAEPAGSRPVRRQHDGWSSAAELSHPSQIRAIPNNSILQNLGLLANTVTGLGRAVERHPELFRAMHRDSPRFRRAMIMAETAHALGDLDVLRAYIDIMDAGVWLNRSARTRSPERRQELRAIARELDRSNLHRRLVRVYRRLQSDNLLFRDALAETQEAGIDVATLDPSSRDDLDLLHALRIALIQRIYLMSSHIPDFSPNRDVTRDDLMQRILHLEIDNALEFLSEVFPRQMDSEGPDGDFHEPATYGSGAPTYERVHAQLFEPIGAWFEMVRRIGAAITHHMGAIG